MWQQNDVSLFMLHIVENRISTVPRRDPQMTWEQRIQCQISNSFLAVQGVSCMARCFSLGKPFHPPLLQFPAPKRKRIQFYPILAALQVMLERSHGEPLAGLPEWGLSAIPSKGSASRWCKGNCKPVQCESLLKISNHLPESQNS